MHPEACNGEGIQAWKLGLLPDKINGWVLDAGSGVSAPYRGELSARAKGYVAVDIRGGEDVLQLDVRNLHKTYKRHFFAYCWASELFEHLDGATEVLGELKRVARHGCATWPGPRHPNFPLDPDHREPDLDPALYTERADGECVLEW